MTAATITSPFFTKMSFNPKSSIQDTNNNNERSAGRIVGSIKPKKIDKVRLYLHPSSIPTKFQTIHYDDNEQKAFNSSMKRFSSQIVI